MVIDSKALYTMLTSPIEDDVTLAMGFAKMYKGNDKKLVRLINFYKILQNKTYEYWELRHGSSTKHTGNFPLCLNMPQLNLDLSYNNKLTIDYLPDNLTIGTLVLTNCKGLRQLPNNLVVVNYLYITSTNIQSIPKNLSASTILCADTPYYKNLQQIDKNARDRIENYADTNRIGK